MNRRSFLRGALGMLATPTVIGRTTADNSTTTADNSTTAELSVYHRPGLTARRGRVALVSDLIPGGTVLRSNLDPLPLERCRHRLDAGMSALLGATPWTALFDPTDTVAIKINGLAAGRLSPRRELITAIIDLLQGAGVSPGRIIVWERTSRELQRCGFALQTGESEVRVYGTDALRGGGYSETIESFGSVGSLPSRIITDYSTALINVGVLKDHDLAGISAGLKNLYGVIHNPNRYHDNACNPYVAEVAALPSVRRKLRLTIIDAVLAQAHGGPAFASQWLWPCNRLLIGVDPVAVDQIAWELIEQRRATLGLPDLKSRNRAPDWIATAAALGLGNNKNLTRHEV